LKLFYTQNLVFVDDLTFEEEREDKLHQQAVKKPDDDLASLGDVSIHRTKKSSTSAEVKNRRESREKPSIGTEASASLAQLKNPQIGLKKSISRRKTGRSTPETKMVHVRDPNARPPTILDRLMTFIANLVRRVVDMFFNTLLRRKNKNQPSTLEDEYLADKSQAIRNEFRQANDSDVLESKTKEEIKKRAAQIPTIE